ncbi:MAPEG family protein [Nitrosomonas sp. Nm51]|uniref:MAPEG family protein n=1 Tax=Nitrosomonas sp. Nm51 TaxID=133720 RepID=UPI0008C149E3|nr:MAPEG family protein [Nitrosomonas sp. Nm51]SER55005.1 MAPEG family protein [Nitrosomonas sp. Nm51]
MTTLIIGTLALALFQLWLLPATLNIKNLPYMLSSRDKQIESSMLQSRVSRAGINLQESLPAFLALALLAITQQVDLAVAATIWLGLRVLYVPCYMFNIIYVRTLIWLGSIGCLIYMASKLI